MDADVCWMRVSSRLGRRDGMGKRGWHELLGEGRDAGAKIDKAWLKAPSAFHYVHYNRFNPFRIGAGLAGNRSDRKVCEWEWRVICNLFMHIFVMSPSTVVPSSPSRAVSRLQTLVLALCLALAPAIAIGFGRFAYALVLPAMKTDLGWSFSQAGSMGTANALGYLIGALATGPLLRFVGPRPLMLIGLGLSVVALWGAASTSAFTALLFFRGLVGFSAAPTFICATGLAARLGSNAEENALAMGLTICGPGIGTILTGTLVPLLLEGEASRWPRAWGAMGLLGVLAFAVVIIASRGMSGGGTATNESEHVEEKAKARGGLGFAYFSYFLFGLGYIAYMTFLVAFVRGLNASSGTVSLVWTCLGVAMLASSFAWKGQLAKNRGGFAMMLMGVGGAVCALLPLISGTLPALLISAIGFGATTMPVVTAITVLVRRHLPAARWNGSIAAVTAVFAVGQSLGPLAAGQLSDHFGASASLWWSAGVLGLAAIAALGQKPYKDAAQG
ncbi:YbfB/YjiJ family MFS transporter [bacterium]|nr:MAG: YbfB/YjiJ family MFS transporter [bacterium]